MKAETNHTQSLVDEHEAAQHLGLSVHTLRKDRRTDRRIPFFKVRGSVRYSLSRVDEALREMEHGAPEVRPLRRRA